MDMLAAAPSATRAGLGGTSNQRPRPSTSGSLSSLGFPRAMREDIADKADTPDRPDRPDRPTARDRAMGPLLTDAEFFALNTVINAWVLNPTEANEDELSTLLWSLVPPAEPRPPPAAKQVWADKFKTYCAERHLVRRPPFAVRSKQDAASALFWVGVPASEVASVLSISRRHTAVLRSRYRKGMWR